MHIKKITETESVQEVERSLFSSQDFDYRSMPVANDCVPKPDLVLSSESVFLDYNEHQEFAGKSLLRR